MKTMTCAQLGGACNKEFHAETFEEMAQLSQQHGMEMHQQQDAPHLEAMQKMQALMQDKDKMAEWFADRKAGGTISPGAIRTAMHFSMVRTPSLMRIRKS